MTLRAFVLLLVICCVGASVGCKKRQKYFNVPLSEFEARKPFEARVVHVVINNYGLHHNTPEALITLESETGERIAIGLTAEGTNLVEFARTLKVGNSYEFPKTWLAFRNNRATQVKAK